MKQEGCDSGGRRGLHDVAPQGQTAPHNLSPHPCILLFIIKKVGHLQNGGRLATLAVGICFPPASANDRLTKTPEREA